MVVVPTATTVEGIIEVLHPYVHKYIHVYLYISIYAYIDIHTFKKRNRRCLPPSRGQECLGSGGTPSAGAPHPETSQPCR